MTKKSRLVSVASGIAFLNMILFALIFGFFYAYACSVMWGLDLVSPAVAIEAMNGMNTAVRNPVFAASFFGLIPLTVLSALLLWFAHEKKAFFWFLTALVIYSAGAFSVTASFSVPLNRDLLIAEIPDGKEAISGLWTTYSERWQFWNWVRCIMSGLAFCCAAVGWRRLGGPRGVT